MRTLLEHPFSHENLSVQHLRAGKSMLDSSKFLVPAGGKKGKKGTVNGKKSEESDIFKLVKMIMQRNFDPVRLLPCQWD